MIPHHTHLENDSQSVLRDFPLAGRDIAKRANVSFLPQISSADSTETIHVGLYEALLGKGTDGVIEKLKEYADERRRLTVGLRDKVKLQTAIYDEALASKKIVGADAGRNGTNYRFAFVPLYGAVAVLIDNWKLTEEPICASGVPDIWPTEKDPDRRESLLHMALEYHVARKAVEQWHPNYVIFDGGLVLNPRLHTKRGDAKKYHQDFVFTVLTALSFLDTCKKEGVNVVGFVKRTQMSRLYSVFDIPPMRDSIFLNPLMELGEYTAPLLIKNLVTNTYHHFAEEFGLSEDLVDMYTGYIKTCHAPPYRIEVPLFCLNRIKEIASILLTMADPEGIPYPVHEADQYTKISSPTSNIHTLVLYSKALDLVKKGLLDPTDLDLLILQYGEQWSLRESEFWEELGKVGGRG